MIAWLARLSNGIQQHISQPVWNRPCLPDWTLLCSVYIVSCCNVTELQNATYNLWSDIALLRLNVTTQRIIYLLGHHFEIHTWSSGKRRRHQFCWMLRSCSGMNWAACRFCCCQCCFAEWFLRRSRQRSWTKWTNTGSPEVTAEVLIPLVVTTNVLSMSS